MLEELKKRVTEANKDLERLGLVIFTWGNVSEKDRETGFVAIKPSGVEYKDLAPSDIVVLAPDGTVKEGTLRPSSDTPTHLEMYREHPEIGAIVHTHSTFATAFAQAGKPIPAYGTTHADYFYGEIPCTGELTEKEVRENYELNTGRVINRTLKAKDVMAVPAVLVRNHGVFAWGKDASEAVYHAKVVEEVAKMAYLTLFLNPDKKEIPEYISDKHYLRKHGKDAYYGQETK